MRHRQDRTVKTSGVETVQEDLYRKDADPAVDARPLTPREEVSFKVVHLRVPRRLGPASRVETRDRTNKS